MPYTPSDRLKAFTGANGIGATLLLVLSTIYKLIDAAGNADFVLQKLPALARLMEAFPVVNVLILLALLWIVAILTWPAELGPNGARVRKVKALLREAEEFHEKHGETVKKFSDDSVHEAAWRMTRMFTFLQMAFAGERNAELAKFQDREHQKHKEAGAAFDPDRTIAKYLRELRKRVKGDDLDPSFHMPDTYAQFYKTDAWVANSVD